ncbi:hypothetical protein [Roseateles sp.]|jgi:hypothetical protein|uniref:hypothetical protein n=1 Tax=Roseateles sp. TaxID=1971397 RepID=UPI003BAAD917
MSHLKTVTSAVTAVFLVSGIGLAVAQSEDTPPVQQPSTMTQATDQAPADPTAMPLNDTTAQQQPADPTRSQPPADPTAPLPAQDPAQMQATPPAQDSSTMPSSAPSYDAASEPAPRADRN